MPARGKLSVRSQGPQEHDEGSDAEQSAGQPRPGVAGRRVLLARG
jgi:hypothetical protein